MHHNGEIAEPGKPVTVPSPRKVGDGSIMLPFHSQCRIKDVKITYEVNDPDADLGSVEMTELDPQEVEVIACLIRVLLDARPRGEQKRD